jgi:hypothetical protein
MSAPITERLDTALRTHSLRQDAEGLKVWLLETDVADAAAIITELTAALEAWLPKNICLTNRNIPDNMNVPLEADITMGELRAIAALIAKARNTTLTTDGSES